MTGNQQNVDGLTITESLLFMVQVDAAVAKKANIVLMCNTPHHMFSLYELIPLEEPAHNPDK